ncbi:MAG: D-alanyl-D-alanine carboxypeptidase family protein [Pseudomonadota bacterium]
MKRIVFSLLGLFVLAPAWAVIGLPPAPPKVEARAWLLLDASSGQVLAARNEDQKLEPASLTKLMTAYVVFDAVKRGRIDKERTFVVPEEAGKVAGARMFARVGQAVGIDDLLMALVVQSANDAALTLAEGIAGSEAAFVEMMNAQATRLGLASTRFRNATGHSHPEHYSTARDMTRLANWLIVSFPEQYRRYFAAREFSFNGVTQQNRNRLLWLDPQVDGVKTGYTQAAGYCLIASAERGKRRLIATVMGARSEADRGMYAQKLLNYGFLETESLRFYRAGQPVARVAVYKGSESEVGIGFLSDFSMTTQKGVANRIKAQVITRQPYLAPLKKGQAMGTLRLTLDGETVGDYPLVALADVPVAGWFGRFWDGLRLLWK